MVCFDYIVADNIVYMGTLSNAWHVFIYVAYGNNKPVRESVEALESFSDLPTQGTLL